MTNRKIKAGLHCETESLPCPQKIFCLARERGREREKEKERDLEIHLTRIFDSAYMYGSAASCFLLRFPVEEELNFPDEGSGGGNLPLSRSPPFHCLSGFNGSRSLSIARDPPIGSGH